MAGGIPLAPPGECGGASGAPLLLDQLQKAEKATTMASISERASFWRRKDEEKRRSTEEKLCKARSIRHGNDEIN